MYFPDTNLNVAPLQIGDVEILHTDPDFRIVIERKSERDLGASLRDGRYREQKARMLATVPAHHCIYLVENPNKPTWDDGACTSCSLSAYSGAIIHTMFRDGIHVAITDGLEDTAAWIATIYGKCRNNPDKFVFQPRDASYLSCAKIKTKKCDNLDPQTCYLLQLAQIPGISTRLAQEIANIYPSWRSLIRALDNELETGGETGCVRMLSHIPLIGSKKAHVILDYLRQSADDNDKCP